MSPQLRVQLLGGFNLSRIGEQDSKPRPLQKPPTAKSQSLLACLIVNRARPLPRERLTGMFWGDRPDRRARRSLSTALWHLRRGFPDHDPLQANARTVRFTYPHLWVDTETFETAAMQSGLQNLETALTLYQGAFLDGFYDDWIIEERYRLEEIYHHTLARLMRLYATRTRPAAALATAQRLLHTDPLREDAHRTAMRAHCQLGQRNAALEQYHACRQIIQQELGVEPMPETVALFRDIQQGRIEIGSPQPESAPPNISPTPTGHHPLDAAIPPRLVGRTPDMAQLSDKWTRVLQKCSGQTRSRQGSLLFVRGEAGVGKTCLLETFAGQVGAGGSRVLWGRCYEFERLLPYQPLTEALRPLAADLTPDDWRALPAWVTALLARLLPEVGESAPIHGQDASRLFEAVTRFLAAFTDRWPILLVLEDLHWASDSTLQLIHYLARRLENTSLLIIGTYRPEEVGRKHPLTAFQRQTRTHTLALARLSSEAVSDWVAEMSGLGDAARPLGARLFHETEGNPFFLVEIVKTLFETGVLRLEAGIWQGAFTRLVDGDIPLPDGVSAAVEARVARLGEDVRDALRAAAVLGREFDFDLFAAAFGRGTEPALEAVDVLLRRRLIAEGTGDLGRDYTFTHHKIQEVIYTALPRRKRQHLHGRAGAAMEGLYAPDLDDLAPELAHHFDHARRLDRALTPQAAAYLRLAGEGASARFAHPEAADYFTRALALTPNTAHHEQYDLLAAREKIFDVTGARESQSADLTALAALAQTLGDTPRQVETALRQARYHYVTGDYPAAISTAQTAIHLAEAGPLIHLRAEGHFRWAESLWAHSDFGAARGRFEQARTLAQSASASEIEANCLRGLGLVATDQGDYAGARGYFEQALQIVQHPQTGSPPRAAKTLGSLGNVLRNEGDYAAAQRCYEQALHIHRQTGDRYQEGIATLNLGVVLWDQSDLPGAREYLQESLHISREVRDRTGEGLALNNLGRLSVELGDFAGAREFLDSARSVYAQTGGRKGESFVLQSLGNVSTYLGDFAGALSAYRQALTIRREIGDRRGEGYCLRGLGDTALAHGEFAEAGAHFEGALAIFREIGEARGEGEARRGLGTLAAQLGDYARAETHLKAALEIFHSPRDEASVFVPFADLLRRMGDDEAAREYAQKALDAAREVGNRAFQAAALLTLGHARFGLGQLEEAGEAYRESLALRQALGQPHLAAEPRAGLARVARAQGETA